MNVLATDPNSTAITGNGFLNGVQGISTSTFGSGIGVMGQSSSFAGVGVYGISPLYGERGIASSSTGTNYGVHGTTFSSTGYAVYANGNFGGTGFKYFVQPHPTDPSKEVRFVCLEGNESGTYFRGSAKIEKGIATIEVPEDFRLVTEASGMTVQVTPVGGRAELWIDSKDLDKVVIRGTADVKFDYFVNGVRRGFADHKSIQENHSFVPAVRGVPFGTQFPEALRKILVANQILNPDLTPNEATAARLGWQLQDPTPATSGGK